MNLAAKANPRNVYSIIYGINHHAFGTHPQLIRSTNRTPVRIRAGPGPYTVIRVRVRDVLLGHHKFINLATTSLGMINAIETFTSVYNLYLDYTWIEY